MVARMGAEQDETMYQALEAWIAAKQREPGARANSIATYQGRIAHVFAYFGPVPVRSVRPDELPRFVEALLSRGGPKGEGLAPATVQGIYAALTSTLRHAQRRGVIRDLPLPPGGPGIPTPQPREHDLTLTQVEEVIDRMPGVWGQVAELVLLTGLRWGEINAVTRDDIDGRILHVRRTTTRGGATNAPKTRAGARPVPLSPRAQTILRGMSLPVNGDYRQARLTLVAAMGDLHKPGMGWHTIRAAHSSLLDASGVSLREAAARMGHGDNFAQTLAYSVRSEAGDAGALDRVRGRR
jgi:integrase